MEESKRFNTEFDGKIALIIGDHPHSGATAECIGSQLTPVGAGLVFKNNNTKEEFFVFLTKHVKWI